MPYGTLGQYPDQVDVCIFRLNPQQILDYLREIESEDNNVDEIIIQPPSPDYASGEDDANEDSGGNIHDIHHNQIQDCIFIALLYYTKKICRKKSAAILCLEKFKEPKYFLQNG